MRAETFQRGNTRFEAMVRGEGSDTIAFVHGFPDTSETWNPLWERLQTTRRLVSIPLPGWDEPLDDQALPIQRLTNLLVARLRALNASRLTYVGHDWGAVLGWSIAAHFPDVLDDAVLMSVPPLRGYIWRGLRSPRQLWRSRYIAGFQLPALGESRLEDGDYVEELWRRWSPGEPPAAHVERVQQKLAECAPSALAYYRGLRQLFLDPNLRRFVGATPEIPCLGIFGLKDRCVSADLWRGSGQAIGRASSIVSLDAGHWPQWEATNALAEIIDKFA